MEITKEKAVETIMVLVLVLLIAYFKFQENTLLYVATGLLVMALISTSFSVFIARIWFGFSHYFGLVMNVIVLGSIFYIFLTPLAFFQGLFGSNQIGNKHKNDSFFIKRNHKFSLKDIEKPW